MEIFVDGGMFEVFIALILGLTINYIFSKKYLLIIYSIVISISPFLLLLIHSGDALYFIISFQVLNSSLLIILLWREYKKNPTKSLIDLNRIIDIKKNLRIKNQ